MMELRPPSTQMGRKNELLSEAAHFGLAHPLFERSAKMKIKRYDFVSCDEYTCDINDMMVEDDSGDWVRYEDVKAALPSDNKLQSVICSNRICDYCALAGKAECSGNKDKSCFEGRKLTDLQ
jgi:hypothetical protein